MVSDIPTSNGSRSKTIRMLEYMDVMGVVVRAKKPDWAQRAAEKQFKKWKHGDAWLPEFAKTLRAHHREVKRMVQNLKAAKHGLSVHTLDEVLAKLKEMER